MRVITCFFCAVLCLAASAARADQSLRHVEYAVTTHAGGRVTSTRIVLDLVGTTNERGVALDVAESPASPAVHVDVDARGVATAGGNAALSPEAKLLVYFFALGAQNMTGLGRGDEWAADGETGDGASHHTRFRVVRAAGPGRLDIAFTRDLEASAERSGYRGRLLYDAFKVVPVSVEARADGAGVVRIALTLVKDSQE